LYAHVCKEGWWHVIIRGRHDRMLVGFTSTYVISTYHY